MPDLDIDLFVGSPDEEQPDWRVADEDDGIDDDDDPEPITAEILAELLGFDPSEEDEKKGFGIEAFKFDDSQPRDDSGKWTSGGGGHGGSVATAGPAKKPAGASGSGATASDAEIKQKLDALYPKAEKAKQEIDSVASNIAEKVDHGSSVVKVPLKGKERALEKAKNDYGGDVSRLTDIARNTIVADEKVHGEAIAILENHGAAVKKVDAHSDPMGYSGINVKMPTKAGVKGEIQVNSAKMIFAKEPEVIAKAILGEQKYSEIAAKAKVPGGLGHKFYEEYRSLPPGHPKAKELESKSRAYYNDIRERVH